MLDLLFERIPGLRKNWSDCQRLFTEINVRAKATLLREGEVSRKMFLVKKGCLRAFVENHDKEVTFQFFFENEMVASIESFRSRLPSPISIQSIEPSELIVLTRNGFETLLNDFPEFKDILLEIAFKRFGQYARLFLSHLRNNPRQRYEELLKEDPRIVKRVPQHLIASYLGITPVSLSRIRRKI